MSFTHFSPSGFLVIFLFVKNKRALILILTFVIYVADILATCLFNFVAFFVL